jgi:hypothetical protein
LSAPPAPSSPSAPGAPSTPSAPAVPGAPSAPGTTNRLDKGFFGEQGAGFFLGSQGYFFVEGPSGAAGHAANASGFDGVAFNPTIIDLILNDNKTFASDRNVRSATAIDPAVNLAQNLDALINRLTTARDIPRRMQILDLLRQTRLSLTSKGVSPPPNVRIAVTNFGGNSPDITQALRDRGLTFIDMDAAPRVPVPVNRVYVNRVTIPQLAHDVSADVAAYNTRQGKAEALAVVTATGAQVLNDMALGHSIEEHLADLTEKIEEAMVTKGGALVVVRVSATSPSGVLGGTVSHKVESAYVANLPSGLTQKRAIELFLAQPSIGLGGPDTEMETRLFWYEGSAAQ